MGKTALYYCERACFKGRTRKSVTQGTDHSVVHSYSHHTASIAENSIDNWFVNAETDILLKRLNAIPNIQRKVNWEMFNPEYFPPNQSDFGGDRYCSGDMHTKLILCFKLHRNRERSFLDTNDLAALTNVTSLLAVYKVPGQLTNIKLLHCY